MQKSIWHQLLWGLMLVAVGVVILMNQTGMTTFSVGDLFRTFWPVILIVVGFQGLFVQRSGGYLWNGIVVALGVVFLGRNLGWIEMELGNLFKFIVPLAIIWFGLHMIFGGGRMKRDKHVKDRPDYGWNPVTPPMPDFSDTPKGPPPAPPLSDDPNAPFSDATSAQNPVPPRAETPPSRTESPFPPPNEPHNSSRQGWRNGQARKQHSASGHDEYGGWWNSGNASDHHQFIGDFHIGHDYWELRPMNISHFIGDSTLDLTKAQIPLGETKIYVSCFIGDVKVFVPNDPALGVQVVSSSLIGDVRVWEQKRGGLFNHISLETPGYSDTDKRVVLIVSAFIGDVRVTKVG